MRAREKGLTDVCSSLMTNEQLSMMDLYASDLGDRGQPTLTHQPTVKQPNLPQ